VSTAATRAAASVAAPRARILVVDDDQATRRVLRRALAAAGYQVEVARDGLEALAMLPLGVSLLVVDGVMPGLDGCEVARRIRADPARRGLPILMITGMDTPANRARAAEAGVSGFLAKPYEIVELRRCCATLLRAAAAAPDRAQTPYSAPVR
jgi:CheY-like chemotaxis protein